MLDESQQMLSEGFKLHHEAEGLTGRETAESCTFDAKTEHNNRVILSVAAAGCERAQINCHRPNLVNAQRVHVTRDSDRLCYGAADMCARHLTAVSDVSRASSCVASC